LGGKGCTFWARRLSSPESNKIGTSKLGRGPESFPVRLRSFDAVFRIRVNFSRTAEGKKGKIGGLLDFSGRKRGDSFYWGTKGLKKLLRLFHNRTASESRGGEGAKPKVAFPYAAGLWRRENP